MAERTRGCLPEVLLSEDMMTAKLKLHLQEGAKDYSVEELKSLLAAENVKTGIIEETIADMIDHEIYDIFMEVARGKEAVDGKDGYYIFHVQNSEQDKSPTILEDGKVEYVRTVNYTTVNEGDLVAEYVPATAGEFGYTLDNQILNPKRGKELTRLKGRGFRFEDGKYYSTIHGKVEITDLRIQITNMLEIPCDVDVNYGHVNFDGDVEIRGDVHSGMMVKATGNIEIKGHVGNCYIEAGKNIIIQRGMQGKLTGKIKAGGDIICKFFENSQAVADGDITVRTVLNSKLEAEGKITVEGKNSVVIGGSVHAVQGMEIMQAGNVAEVATKLVAGVMPQTISRNIELSSTIKKVEEEIALLDKAARIMERMTQTNVTKETANRRMKIIQAKVIKATELKKCQQEKKHQEALIDSGKGATVVVQNVIFPNCRVEIAGVGMDVKEQIKHAKFLLKDGEIEAALLY